MSLTEKSVTKLAASTKRLQVYDDELTGFGVRIEPKPSGRKSFFWYAKVNGMVRFRSLGEFPAVTVSEARTAAKALIGTAAKWKQADYQGEDPFEKKKRIEPSNTPLFRELVEAYIQNHVRKEANTPARAEYQVNWMAKKHLSAWFDRRIDKIGVEDVLTAKNACGEHRHMANRIVETVRAIYNWSAGKNDDGKLNFWHTENPAKDVGTFDEESRTRFLQPDELVRFDEAIENEKHADLKDFLLLAITTGARRGDLFSMRWQDVKWELQKWTVPYPKNGQSYDVQLLPASLEVLKQRRTRIPDSVPYVFPGVGESGHLIDLKKPWIEFRKRAQLTDLRLHDVRRTVASYQAISGVSLQKIASSLGHKSLQSVEIYANLHDQAVREGREQGQAKMLEMMEAAKKRLKTTTRRQKLLPAVARG